MANTLYSGEARAGEVLRYPQTKQLLSHSYLYKQILRSTLSYACRSTDPSDLIFVKQAFSTNYQHEKQKRNRARVVHAHSSFLSRIHVLLPLPHWKQANSAELHRRVPISHSECGE